MIALQKDCFRSTQFLTGSGTFISLVCRSTRRAVIVNELLAVGLWLPVLCCIFPVILMPVNPFVLLARSMSGLTADPGSVRWPHMGFGFGIFRLGPLVFTGYLALVCLLYAFLGYMLLRLGVRRFHRHSRKR